MKRLLVLMLCAMLAVPAVGMNVNATTNQVPQLNVDNSGKGTAANLPSAISENTEDDISFGKLAKDATNELSDYYLLLDVTNEQKKAADDAMSTAAKQLGFIYTAAEKAPDVGVFSTNAQTSPLIKSKDGIKLCVETTKGKLDKANEIEKKVISVHKCTVAVIVLSVINMLGLAGIAAVMIFQMLF